MQTCVIQHSTYSIVLFHHRFVGLERHWHKVQLILQEQTLWKKNGENRMQNMVGGKMTKSSRFSKSKLFVYNFNVLQDM